jgi:hypothetical protein
MTARLHSYDADIVAWADEQARLLRERQFSKLDIEHIAEEIERRGKERETRIEKPHGPDTKATVGGGRSRYSARASWNACGKRPA